MAPSECWNKTRLFFESCLLPSELWQYNAFACIRVSTDSTVCCQETAWTGLTPIQKFWLRKCLYLRKRFLCESQVENHLLLTKPALLIHMTHWVLLIGYAWGLYRYTEYWKWMHKRPWDLLWSWWCLCGHEEVDQWLWFLCEAAASYRRTTSPPLTLSGLLSPPADSQVMIIKSSCA